MADLAPATRCPECGSERLYRDGLRYLSDGEAVQRWLCRDCGFRFSWPKAEGHGSKNLKTEGSYNVNRCSSRVLALLEQSEGGPIMSGLEENGQWAAGATEKPTEADVKGKILEFLWYLKRQGRKETTIKSYAKVLTSLSKQVD
ncbi:MAG: IS1/IS1595 family N-terminal zinc-binding domain-containing protein, partial [Candidatus Bathyarchaeales archaeon]